MAKWGTSLTDDVDSSSDKMAIVQHQKYLLTATKALWWTVDVTGGSAAANTAGSHYLPADGEREIVTSAASQFIHYIQDSEAGQICLSEYAE